MLYENQTNVKNKFINWLLFTIKTQFCIMKYKTYILNIQYVYFFSYSKTRCRIESLRNVDAIV